MRRAGERKERLNFGVRGRGVAPHMKEGKPLLHGTLLAVGSS